MKGLRTFPGWKRPGWLMPRALGVAALICLVLVVLLTTIQVTHIHPLNSDTNHCPLCIVMHTAAPAAPATAAVVLVALGMLAPGPRGRLIALRQHPTFFIRPPPFGNQDVFPGRSSASVIRRGV